MTQYPLKTFTGLKGFALQVQIMGHTYSIRVIGLWMSLLIIGLSSCTNDRLINDDNIDIDTDGDGILDSEEILNGTNKNDPCDPAQNADYTEFDALNVVWSVSDCDRDGVSNADEIANATNPYFNEANLTDLDYAVPEFLPKLSELRLFQGNLSDLELNKAVHEYEMSTALFTDYSYKLRSFALPKGEQMIYEGEGLFFFPDNTVLAKTFYYLNDERNPSLGKRIIETRILIKQNGVWSAGNYFWNTEQTEAFLDEDAHIVQLDYIDNQGNTRMLNYKVPANQLCVQCHDNNGSTLPIGPKARALNFTYNGRNQIQDFVDRQLLQGAPAVSQITELPDWSDNTISLEDRARAYLDVNCAHCHQPGGSYNLSFGDAFDFRYETSFEDSNIFESRVAIQGRMTTQIPGYFMPLIGTSEIHTEGVELIDTYVNSLD